MRGIVLLIVLPAFVVIISQLFYSFIQIVVAKDHDRMVDYEIRFAALKKDLPIHTFVNYVLDSHPDYPLLIPVSVFRLWHYLGKDFVAIPILIAGFYTFGSILLISSSVSIIRGENQGYVAGIFMLLATNYLKIGTWQYADIPLAFYILSTIILLSLREVYPIAALRIMFLTGLTASCAAWTKK